MISPPASASAVCLFPAVGILALPIALPTVAGHSLHVAAAPPVNALRQE